MTSNYLRLGRRVWSWYDEVTDTLVVERWAVDPTTGVPTKRARRFSAYLETKRLEAHLQEKGIDTSGMVY